MYGKYVQHKILFAMMLVFVLQVSAAITGFTLIRKSIFMVSDQLDTMMRYYNNEYQLEVDWIQTKVSVACYIQALSLYDIAS